MQLTRLAQLVPYLPVLLLWVAVFATASLVVRELGFGRLKKYPFTTLVLVVSLLALPAGGVYKASKPYQKRLAAVLRREKSPAVLGRGCEIFPADNIWNTRITKLPVDANSSAYLATMQPNEPLHADFGIASGIPYAVSDGSEPPAHMTFGAGARDSDPGPYRIPENAPIEPAADSHVLVVNTGQCVIYELFGSVHSGPNRWFADSAAIFDLRSNRLRPDEWTSADAAGTSIFAGLARYEEVEAGRINHALRITTRRTRRAYVWPAKHYASSSNDPHFPPMGQRFRLRPDFDLSRFSQQTRVLLTALKEYGAILSDNGGNWYISGAPDSRWSSSVGREFATVRGMDFEAVDSSSLMIRSDSGQARQ